MQGRLSAMADEGQLAVLPPAGRLAGIDYGHVRIGVAVCDRRRTLASPYGTLRRRNPQADAAWFRRLITEEEIVGFVVGLPVRADGSEGPQAAAARRFGCWLEATTGLPVAYFDERYTTREAQQALADAGMRAAKARRRLDMLAAQAVLAGYLEATSRQEPPRPLDA